MRWVVQSIGITALITATITGCTARSATPPAPARATGDTSMNALDWPGAYLGTLPCGDCQGIETALLLRTDNSYQLATRYIGRPGDLQVQHGTFTWNAEGNQITLAGISASPNRFIVGEGRLIQLDMQGNRITGDIAERYVLQKSGNAPTASGAASSSSLANSSWTLSELRGKPIPVPTIAGAPSPLVPTLVFAAEESRVGGNAGCNTFSGSYEFSPPNRLRFTPLAMTRRACPDMSTEAEFSRALGETDSFMISGNELQLFRARMAPLAKFVRTPARRE